MSVLSGLRYSNIYSYNIPNGVTKLDNQCFSGCTNLKSITIPTSVSELGHNCFSCCSKLSSIIIPSSVTHIGSTCFSGCTNLKSITIPNSIKVIDDYCFSGCSNLSSITLGNSVTRLGNECFSGCSNLSSIIIPNSVTRIGARCFYKCYNLKTITIPTSVLELDDCCFCTCGISSSITIPTSVTYIGKFCCSCAACYECKKGILNVLLTHKNHINTHVLPLIKTKEETEKEIKDIVKLELDSKKQKKENKIRAKLEEEFVKMFNERENQLKELHSIELTKLKEEKDNEINKLKEEVEKLKRIISIYQQEECKIEIPQISDDYNPDLLNYNEYIKERTELIETYQNKSVVKYHESIVDIAEDFNENVKIKQLELQEYSKVIQTYSNNLSEISSNLTKKINQHTQKLKEIEENNYKLPELNTIPQFDQIVTPKFKSNSYEIEINLNENYYHKDDLIIPKTNNPYTEIYKLPCKFTEINSSNMRLLANHEKKIALLSIEYPHEYIDLSNTDIQYFIDTFKNCMNLKEIRYPDSVEYK